MNADNLDAEAQVLLNDFINVARIAGVTLPAGALSFKTSPAPHEPPPALTKGGVAVYIFILNGKCLKVGKVGPKSHARFTSHHYSPSSSQSNLAKSILADRETMGIQHITEHNVGKWIKDNVDRVNFFLSAANNISVLNLLESFLQCRLQPRFEGFKSQR